VSIEEIMSDAGLTHGGFYRHFTGTDELYAAAVRQFLCKKAPAAWQKGRAPRAITKPRAQRIVDAYFSREHFDDRDGCCPLLGTASDVQRRGAVVKVAYQEVVEQLVRIQFQPAPHAFASSTWLSSMTDASPADLPSQVRSFHWVQNRRIECRRGRVLYSLAIVKFRLRDATKYAVPGWTSMEHGEAYGC
jgi:AcrR family transcriptional regulator